MSLHSKRCQKKSDPLERGWHWKGVQDRRPEEPKGESPGKWIFFMPGHQDSQT